MKTRMSSNALLTLPDEILIYIFSYLSNKDLSTLQKICKRFYILSKTPSLWTKVTLPSHAPSEVVCKWLRQSPLLKQLDIQERRDLDVILQTTCKYCKKLRSIQIKNTNSMKMSSIKSKNLCKLLTKCKNLSNIHFTGIKIRSKKFFKLLFETNQRGVTRRYYGPVSHQQMRALIEGIVLSNNDASAIFITDHNSVIPLQQLSVRTSNDAIDIPGTVNNIWEDISNDVDDADEDFVPLERQM